MNVKRAVKLGIVRSHLLRQLLNRITGDFPKVFVYHRFAPPGQSKPGFDSSDEFNWHLDQIGDRFDVITVAECLEHFTATGKWPLRSVIITVDDGYRDFYEYAFPGLAKRGLKATFYVTTNFIDGTVWLWPDRLEHAISSTTVREVSVTLSDRREVLPLRNEREKSSAWKKICNHCLVIPDDDKTIFIDALLMELRVTLPEKPIAEYAAVNWSELQELSDYGIEIGSHTLNHPIMSRLCNERIIEELLVSKNVLEERLGAKVSTFCYPNSDPDDITDAVVEAVQHNGYSGAVFGINLKQWTPYLIPRMGVPDNREDFLWKLYGGELLTS